jgi:hypothetical protein
MRPELQKVFEAQAAWQRSRAALSWPEKIRIAEAMRESARQLRCPRSTTHHRHQSASNSSPRTTPD